MALCVPGSEENATRNSAYSQTTRAVDVAEVLLDKETWGEQRPVERLASFWQVKDERRTATWAMAQDAEPLEYPEPEQAAPSPVDEWEALVRETCEAEQARDREQQPRDWSLSLERDAWGWDR